MKVYRQYDSMDCGATCLQMIAKFHGKYYTLQYLREHSYIDREGVSVRGISEAAEHIGLRTLAVKLPFESEGDEPGVVDAQLPMIVHWEQKHFVIVYKINTKYVWIADPAQGKQKISITTFKKHWHSDGDKGIAILLETTPDFFTTEGEKVNKTGFSFLFQYLKPFKTTLSLLVVTMFLGGLFQLTIPFLTQAIVDSGIANHDIDFIYLILMGMFVLFIGQTTVNLIQGWMLLHIGTRVNVSLITDFLVKLMRLPIAYFDKKMTGDLLQRLGDHRRIETFLTNSTLNMLFSMFNLVVFGAVLLYYNYTIFLLFLGGSALYLGWIFLWLKKRAAVDHQRFRELAKNQESLIELIQGVQEIKLQGSARKHRSRWMNIQARLFRANIRSLSISQYQDTGAAFISQMKDLFITFIAAKAVVDGQMTLGMMLAIQYISGQLNGPLQQFVGFIRAAQDAQLSMHRMSEIHTQEEESQNTSVDILPEKADFVIQNVSFRYNKLSDYALQNVDLVVPAGKVTAIVGASGSGKTTLVKLLLGFYQPTNGNIRIGNTLLSNIQPDLWRKKCGAVMQDGFIFSDTIAGNISESSDRLDKEKLFIAAQMANIQDFTESLPLGYNTKIGAKGNGLSQGQKQRLLIARAVYKNPEFLFFDEATNALDAKNEKIILENLNRFFENRTVIVVAHRLSTVKNADQIIVLDKGELIEKGTHEALTKLRGAYYDLVKNQLELGG